MKYKYILSVALVGTMLGTTSCTGDLDTVPIDKDDLVSEVVFGSDISAYEESLAKIYAGTIVCSIRLTFATLSCVRLQTENYLIVAVQNK